MSHKYNWTVTSKYYYDQTLTTDLLKKDLADRLDSSGRDTQMYSLAGTGLFHWPADREKRHDTSYHYEEETEEPLDPAPTNSTYHHYENFTMATGINFADLRSSAAAAGLSRYGYIPNGLTLGDNTSAGNITFDTDGEIEFAGSNTLANDITFTDGGYVYFQPGPGAGSGNQTLTGLLASRDLDSVFIAKVARGGSVTLSGGQVRRNLRELSIAEEYNGWTPVSSQTGSGILVDGLVVRGVLNSVYVASGASVNHLTVGLDRRWSGSDISAFLNESNGVLVPNYWGSHTNMTIASGGTATNITLGNGGTVYVFGPEDRKSSSWNETTQQWEVVTSYASGTGGILKDLNMASSGGLQFEGVNDPRATWNTPTNAYYSESSSYRSGFLATAPQSSYVWFGSNTSGSNINIGNGGSLYIGKDAHVSAISMGGLTTSTFFKNSSGTTDTWIGDRGAKLQINGGKVSGVVMDPVLQTFDYYSAAHDYFWLHSETIKDAYSSAHGSYGSGEAWSSAMYASASATYRQYMSAMYTSGAVYTNLGDDTAYNRRYVGGIVNVNGGWIMNVSGFSYLGVAADVDVTVSNNVSSWKTYQYTDGNVSKAVGAVSATLDVTGGAHVYNVKIEGGRVIMTGGGQVNARWHNGENKQSNYNLVEDLDLRIDDVLGFGSAYPAVIEFFGEGSGGYKQYISSGGTSGYVDYTWDAIDPGEIHSVTASKGLVVHTNWTTHQDFTYTGSGAVTINGLGTVVLKDNHSRYTSDSYYGKGPYLGSAFDTYYFGVIKGVYNEEDGVLENYTVLDGTDGAFDWTGFLMVGSGGIIQNIGSAAPLKTGNDIVNSDTWTPSYTRDECKVLTVVAGGLADNVTVKGAVSNFEHFESQYTESRAGLLVSSGGTATNVTVLEGGIAMAKGGTIDKVFVGAGGTLYLSGWAGAHQVAVDSYGSQLAGPQYLDTTVLNAVRLDSGGQLTNTLDWGFRKGHAPSVIANKGGGIMNGVTANGVAYVSGLDYAGNITLTKDQQAIDVTVRGFDTITSRDAEGNPTAYTTTIASLNVSSGGIVRGATVGEEGAIYVSEGADVSGLSASGGRIIFENPGSGWGNYLPASATVTGITVEAGGVLEVNSKFGLTASNVQIGENAGLTFTLGDTASEDYTPTELNGTWTAAWGNGTFYTDDGTMSGFGGQFGQEYKDLFYSSSYVSARLSMTVAKGGILTGADLRGYGSVRVTSGGKIFNTHLRGITANIAASGYASGLTATTESTGSAYDTNIYVYGSGAVADKTLLSGGFLAVENGATANGVTLMAPEGYNGPFGNQKEVGPAEMEITAGGRANNVVASAGVITMYDGSSKDPGTAAPTLSNADVHSAATLIVNADGVVLDGTLNLGGFVTTTAERYEWIEVEVTDPDTGNVYTDWQRVTKNNAVANASTLTVNFDLTERDGTEEGAMIDNLANLQGAHLGTITVSADQAGGQYVLAQGADNFTGTLSVKVGSSKLGDFSVGTIWQQSSDVVYSLTNNENIGLCFTVQTTAAAIEDILATVDGEPFQNGKWTNKAVTIKTSVNQYSQSIWYKIKKAVLTRKSPADDGWTLMDNDAGLIVSEYCTIDFMATNAAGVQSRVVTYTVNYDGAAAEIGDLRSDAGNVELYEGNESQVSVTVTDDLDENPVLELQSGDDWTAVAKGENGRYAFAVSGNGEYTLRATDHAGNVATQTVTVDFYSTMPTSLPTVVSAEPNTTAATNQDVTVTAAFSNNATKREYRIGTGEWLDYTQPVVMEENGTVSFRAWNSLGYSDTAEVVIANIDKVAPEAPTAAADITAATNQNVTVSAVFSEDSVKKEYTLDGETWQDYPAGGVIIIINGTVGFRGTDAAGNVSEVTEYVVDNIDKTAPDAPAAVADITELTAQDVTVTATFSEDSAVQEYSLDGESWQAYPADGVVMADIGTVYFRGTDAAGNISPITSFVVENIVKNPPPQPVTEADITAPTNQNVTVSATFTGNATSREYSLDGTTWLEYTEGVVLTENDAVVYFRAGNVAGYSEPVSYKVTNIDRIPPEAPVAAANTTFLTNQDVTVTAAFSDDSAVQEYSLDGESWQAYPADGVVMGDNGTVYFRGTDAAGNISDVAQYAVENIDKEAPEAPVAAANTTFLTNQDVTVTAAFSDDSAVQEYSLDGETWDAYPADGVVMDANGTVYFRGTDAAGNISDVTQYAVENIDKEAPEAPVAAANTTFLTNQDVTVTATFSEDSAVQEYSLDGENWQAYPANGVVMGDNGTVYFRGTDAAGNISDVAQYAVENIDKEAPEAPVAAANTTFLTNQDVTVTAAFSDDSAVQEYSLDGESWQAYPADGVVMAANGTVYFRGTDAVGNISDVTQYAVENIDKEAPEAPVAAAGTTAPTNQDVTVTATFSEDTAVREYSLDGENWQAYPANGVVMADNGTVYFRGTDAAGNISDVAQYTVENIDKIAPETPSGFQVTVFEDRARIDWNDVADNGIAPLNGYEFRYGNSAELSGSGENVAGSMKQFTDLAAGTWYYQVRTLDSAGNASEWTEARSFEIAAEADNTLNVLPGTFLGGGAAPEILSHSADGSIAVIDASTGTSQPVGTLDRSEWQILGSGDYTNDGSTNLLVQDKETGAVYITGNIENGIDGDAVEQQGTKLGVISDGYSLAGTGEFTGSGNSGVLLVSPEQVSIGYSKVTSLDCWVLDSGMQMSTGNLGTMVTTWDGVDFTIPAWLTDEAQINANYYSFGLVGIGDFNGDGKDDVMIRNTMPRTVDGKTITGSGDIFVYLTGNDISGNQNVDVVYTGCAPDPWRIAGLGDLNGDGITDVVLENTSDGMVASWVLNSSGQYSAAYGIGNLSEGQKLAGIGDVDGDNIADVLFTDFDGSLHAWTVSGGAYKGQIALN